jgi:hypothetical protein
MGKVSLFMVMGFNIVFMYMGFTLSDISSHAYHNYINYIDIEQAQFATESVANMALAQLFTSSQANSFYAMSTNPQTITFNGATATLAQYRDLNLLQNTFTIVATYQGYSDTIRIKSRQQSFSQFAMYNVNDGGIQWTAGEVCNGPLHTEGTLTLTTADGTADGRNGNGPLFKGRISTLNGYTLNGKSNPKNLYNGFTGGYQNNLSIGLPSATLLTTNLSASLPLAVNLPNTANKDIYIEFKPNGSMVIKQGAVSTQSNGTWTGGGYTLYGSGNNGLGAGTYTTTPNSSFNGVVALTGTSNANIHIKGKLNGQITLAAVAGSGSVYIDSSVVYNDENVNGINGNPPTSDDMLGIVANHSVIVTDNNNNNYVASSSTGNVNIDATIFSLGLNSSDGFTAQNYNTRNATTLSLLGGLQQNNRQAVGQTKNGVQYGFLKNYVYDNRYVNQFPPGYPVDQYFSLISYYENMGWNKSVWDNW